MSKRREGKPERENFVLIFSKQWSDSPPLSMQTYGRFSTQSQKLDQDWFSLDAFLYSLSQDCNCPRVHRWHSFRRACPHKMAAHLKKKMSNEWALPTSASIIMLRLECSLLATNTCRMHRLSLWNRLLFRELQILHFYFTHHLNRLNSLQLPPTVCSFSLSHIQTSHRVRLFVMGALQRRHCVFICSRDDSPSMRWSGLWDVCLFL